jgi:trans-aconitate methyltransferase
VGNDDGVDVRRQMDTIYQELTLDRIPWNCEEPPERLVALLERKRVVPCDAVDLGCGAGNYAVWLASRVSG